MKKIVSIAMLAGILSLAACHSEHSESVKSCVDYVNPYIGNVSHLLVPTFPNCPTACYVFIPNVPITLPKE